MKHPLLCVTSLEGNTLLLMNKRIFFVNTRIVTKEGNYSS